MQLVVDGHPLAHRRVDVRRHLVVAQTDVRFDADRGVISVTAAADGARPTMEQDMLQPGERPPWAPFHSFADD